MFVTLLLVLMVLVLSIAGFQIIQLFDFNPVVISLTIAAAIIGLPTLMVRVFDFLERRKEGKKQDK